MIERLLRLVVGIVLVVLLVWGGLWAIRLAGFGSLLAVSNESVTPVRPDIAFAPLTDTSLHDPDNPIKVFRVDMAKVEHDFPLSRTDLASLTPANLLAAQPGGGGPGLRPPHRRPDPRRPLPRRPLLLPRRDAQAAARGDPRRPRGPRRRREDRDRRGRRPRPLEGQDVLPRQARAQELRRELRRALRPHRRPRGAGAGDRPARGLAQAPPAHHRRLAALPGQALLRSEPARRAPRVRHHRLRLQRRAARLPGAPRRARRPQRPQHPRRDPHDPPRLLPGPRLRQQGLPPELHALQLRGGGRRQGRLRRAATRWPRIAGPANNSRPPTEPRAPRRRRRARHGDCGARRRRHASRHAPRRVLAPQPALPRGPAPSLRGPPRPPAHPRRPRQRRDRPRPPRPLAAALRRRPRLLRLAPPRRRRHR